MWLESLDCCYMIAKFIVMSQGVLLVDKFKAELFFMTESKLQSVVCDDGNSRVADWDIHYCQFCKVVIQ